METDYLGQEIKILQKPSLGDTIFFGGLGIVGMISLFFTSAYPTGQMIIFVLAVICLAMGYWSFGRRKDGVILYEHGMKIDYAKFKRTVYYREIQEVRDQDKTKKRKRFITFPHFYLADGTAFKLIIPIERENKDLFYSMAEPGFILEK